MEKSNKLAGTEDLLEKAMVEALGADSIDEVHAATKPGAEWPEHFKMTQQEFSKFTIELLQNPASAEEIVDNLTGGKSPEEVKEKLRRKDWPFTVPLEEMRKSVKKTLHDDE